MRGKRKHQKSSNWTDRVKGDALSQTAPMALTSASSPYSPSTAKGKALLGEKASRSRGALSPPPVAPSPRERRARRGKKGKGEATVTADDINAYALKRGGDFQRGIGPKGARTTAARERLRARDSAEAASVDAAFGALSVDAAALAAAEQAATADASFQALLGRGADDRVADEDAFLDLLSPARRFKMELCCSELAAAARRSGDALAAAELERIAHTVRPIQSSSRL